MVVGGSVFLTGAPVCCRFAVHSNSYDCSFYCFRDSPESVRCEYNLDHHWRLWRAYLSTRRGSARAVYPPPVTAVWCPSVTGSNQPKAPRIRVHSLAHNINLKLGPSSCEFTHISGQLLLRIKWTECLDDLLCLYISACIYLLCTFLNVYNHFIHSCIYIWKITTYKRAYMHVYMNTN